MNQETHQCQNCKQDFIIEPDDFAFYEKMKVPAPTFCSECRLQRKLAFRNERTLYKNICKKCNKSLISMYREGGPMTVYCRDCWYSDSWNPMSYGYDYNFSQSFFEQFKKLFHAVPVVNLWTPQSMNSEYTNFATENKNCYLSFGGKTCENVRYAKNSSFSRDSQDLLNCANLELSYENIQCQNSQKLFFSWYSDNCSDSYFLYRCRNCIDCFGCTNLRNKQNCWFNEQLTKEEYKKRFKDVDSGSFKNIINNLEQFKKIYNKSIHKYAQFINTTNCTGDNIRNARDCKKCFDISGDTSENSKYIVYAVQGVKDSYDSYGMPHAERIYEALASGFDMMENLDYAFTFFVRGCKNIQYSINCSASHDLFGCVGLDKKEYCILNVQYTKEEYFILRDKIIKHMNDMPYIDKKDRTYQYGEFFPVELSSFVYNETLAQEHFSLTKEQAEKQGYSWKNDDIKNYNIDIKSEELPDHVKDVDESIKGKIISCAHKGDCHHQCTTAFKIIDSEFDFYKKMNLPFPRLCPNCRHYERLAKKNPMKLWHRNCMKEGCANEFETSYAPDRPEIVYCEACYNQEVA
ncbi:MAG: hypothetical protein WC711_03945 [Candidatus Staskawiczbacteria bacterium]|jgi:hypothetical protein